MHLRIRFHLSFLSSDSVHTVQYSYGIDGQRAVKNSARNETLYFNSMWSVIDYKLSVEDTRESKNVFLGSTRLVTKLNSQKQPNAESAKVSTYYYHADHLGSAQLVTNHKGEEYERIEYTPYGETWIEKSLTENNVDLPYKFTGKELDEETGLYYYGARYLDPKTSRWLSTDPALGEYIPQAPVNDEARQANGNLPGMGGIYNQVNFHLYHYAGNNPVKYVDPDGRVIEWEKADNVSDEDFQKAKDMGENIKNSDTEAGARWRAAEASDRTVKIYVNNETGKTRNYAFPGDDADMTLGDMLSSALFIGGNAYVKFNPNDINDLSDGTSGIPEATLAHEMGHAYLMMTGRNPWTSKGRELDATAVENQYRMIHFPNTGQRGIYGKGSSKSNWAVPQYNGDGSYSIFGTGKSYKLRKVR